MRMDGQGDRKVRYGTVITDAQYFMNQKLTQMPAIPPRRPPMTPTTAALAK
jgi:hypothetical protein